MRQRIKFTDERVCKSHLLESCPHDILSGTVSVCLRLALLESLVPFKRSVFSHTHSRVLIEVVMRLIRPLVTNIEIVCVNKTNELFIAIVCRSSFYVPQCKINLSWHVTT